MALYRTYRPGRLDDVVGQEHVTEPLKRAIANNRIHHAYLFSGPRGCGKTSTARILARSLNCEAGPTADPCGQCQSCIDLAPNGPGSIDVIELDAASHGGVDDTRELRERAMFAPAASRYKIYIIDEAHMVTTAGFNALLKLVEEPPEHVYFIFATTEAEKVLPTIRSRTHNYSFRLVTSRDLIAHLSSVCDAEGVAAEPAALSLVARAGAGSVRDSLSVLGQLIAGAGPEGLTYADALVQLGVTDTALIDATVDALANRDGAELFNVVERVIDAGHDPRRYVTDLLERFRDLIVLSAVPGAAESGLVDAPDDQLASMVTQASRFTLAELSRDADVISDGLSTIRGATAPKLQLELLCARLLLPAIDDGEGGLRARLDHLERQVNTGAFASAASTPAPKALSESASVAAPPKPISEVAPSTKRTPPPKPVVGEVRETAVAVDEPEPVEELAAAPSSALSLAEITSMWPAVLEALKTQSRVSWMMFANSSPMSYADGQLAVGVDNAGTITGAKNNGSIERLESAVQGVLRISARVDLVLAPDAKAPAPAKKSAAKKNATEADVSPSAEGASPDDANADGLSGVDLAMRELGATQIGEIES